MVDERNITRPNLEQWLLENGWKRFVSHHFLHSSVITTRTYTHVELNHNWPVTLSEAVDIQLEAQEKRGQQQREKVAYGR